MSLRTTLADPPGRVLAGPRHEHPAVLEDAPAGLQGKGDVAQGLAGLAGRRDGVR